MACLCKNEDGTLSDICYGSCSKKDFIVIDSVKVRSDKSMEDRFEYMLTVFLSKLDERIYRLERNSPREYNEGVKFGFEMARGIYE